MSAASESFFAERRWERIAPLAGVIAVVLWVVSVFVLELGADTPGDDASAEELAAYFMDESGVILGGGLLFYLGVGFFIWFLGSLRSALVPAEGGVGRLSAIAFGSGIATAAMMLALSAPEVAGGLAPEISDRELTPSAAEALSVLGDGFFLAAELTVAVLLLATSIVALRRGVLPRWLAWASIVVVVVLLIPPIGWAGLVWGFPLWVLIVSVLLWRAYSRAGDAPPPA